MEVLGVVWIPVGVMGLVGLRWSLTPHLILGSALLLGATWVIVVIRGRMKDV
jgi:hypothetical protein